MGEFEGILIRLHSALQESKIDYVLVGGVTVILRGRIRTTMDVDLIVQNDRDAFVAFLKALKKYDFDVDFEQGMYALHEGFNLSIFDNLSPLRLDIKLAKQHNDIQVLKKGEMYKYKNIMLKIAPLEWILFGKILYIGLLEDLKDGQILEIMDVLDFISVWNKNKNSIDREWLTQKCESESLLPTLMRILNLIEQIDEQSQNSNV